MEYAETEPLREFARRRGFSPTTVYAWDDNGLIETVLIGGRRHVLLSSFSKMIERLLSEQQGRKRASPNPRANAPGAFRAPGGNR